MVLVINPIIQYTVFEQLKNLLIARRTNALRAAGGAAAAVAVLSDWDFFFLGALSKLGMMSCFPPLVDTSAKPCPSFSCYQRYLPLHVSAAVNAYELAF